MKHIHIINPYNSPAMQRMTAPLMGLSTLYKITTGDKVDTEADVNIHSPWHTMVNLQYKGEGKHVIMYTHCNPPDVPALLDACERADLITCMSYTGRKELVDIGVDPAKLWVIYAGSDFKFKQKVIGIVGSPQPNGRKRESILLDMAWQYDLSAFEFLFVGSGWDAVVVKLQALGVNANAYSLNDEDLQDVYSKMTALLVTGYTEGGPLPLLEALSVGIPVLAPKLGYAADLLDRHYETQDQLMDWLNELTDESIFNHQLVKLWSWADYVKEYALIIGRLIGESVDLDPVFAASRYSQLLDVIDEVKPKSIVEIGTWNGKRAAQMILQAAKYSPMKDILYVGFDLFGSQTGEQFRRELSKHGWPMDIIEKKLQATGVDIELIEGETYRTLEDGIINADMFFVDGGHSEATIEHDADIVLDNLSIGSVAIFDDYYHEGKPYGVGCNKVIDCLNRNNFEVTHLPVKTVAEDGRVIGMVKVKRNANVHIRMQQQTQAGTDTRNERESAYIVSTVPFAYASNTSNN